MAHRHPAAPPGDRVLVFFQYIEARAAADLLSVAPSGAGYLLEDRVADVGDFIDAITRVADGGTVLDPEVVTHLLDAGRRRDALAGLTPCERDVLTLLAQGRSNTAIAGELFILAKVVEKHVATSSTNSAWRHQRMTTAGSSPPSGTWNPNDQDQRSG